MAERFTYTWVEHLIESIFPDPEPDLECVRAWRAVSGVLMSAALLDTTFPETLAKFTGLDVGFVVSISWNMQNNHLWSRDEYDHSAWLSQTGTFDRTQLEEHVSIAFGDSWCAAAQEPDYSVNVYRVFIRTYPVFISRKMRRDGTGS
jgi:hypothetical protein